MSSRVGAASLLSGRNCAQEQNHARSRSPCPRSVSRRFRHHFVTLDRCSTEGPALAPIFTSVPVPVCPRLRQLGRIPAQRARASKGGVMQRLADLHGQSG